MVWKSTGEEISLSFGGFNNIYNRITLEDLLKYCRAQNILRCLLKHGRFWNSYFAVYFTLWALICSIDCLVLFSVWDWHIISSKYTISLTQHQNEILKISNRANLEDFLLYKLYQSNAQKVSIERILQVIWAAWGDPTRLKQGRCRHVQYLKHSKEARHIIQVFTEYSWCRKSNGQLS